MNSAIILNWNSLDVAKDSARLLIKEGHDVILVDNGSKDGSKEFFRDVFDDNFTLIDFPKNVGISKGRNAGIKKAKGKNIFLIDADILYVKGTIAEYQKVLDAYEDAGCVGQNSMKLLQELGHNGVYDPTEADFMMAEDYTVEDWFPMAWTQYGLFRGDFLRKTKFTEIPPFDEAGYGYEDDFLFQEMKKQNLASLAVDKPIYYHHAHATWRALDGTPDRMDDRAKAFAKVWGKKANWAEDAKNAKRTTRDNPNASR